uniref:Putative product n=1 Tax=Xenopsylla cheopis TaxID=163159 RepID=A0A6M2DY98_XENCH
MAHSNVQAVIVLLRISAATETKIVAICPMKLIVLHDILEGDIVLNQNISVPINYAYLKRICVMERMIVVTEVMSWKICAQTLHVILLGDSSVIIIGASHDINYVTALIIAEMEVTRII